MRDQKKILDAIKKSWAGKKELRFCQWFYFVVGLDDAFYMTDEEFLKKLSEKEMNPDDKAQ